MLEVGFAENFVVVNKMLNTFTLCKDAKILMLFLVFLVAVTDGNALIKGLAGAKRSLVAKPGLANQDKGEERIGVEIVVDEETKTNARLCLDPKSPFIC